MKDAELIKRGESGFTLIELLVVCGIIGILAALAIPNYFYAKRNGLNATAAADMRNILPAADSASSAEPVVSDTYVFLGGGGPIDPALPGARTSDGVEGGVHIEPNLYQVWTHHPSGGICYSYFSDLAPSYRAQPTSGANVCGAS